MGKHGVGIITMIDISNNNIAYLREKKGEEFHVYWSLGNQCTYKCSYCPSIFHDGSVPYQPIDVIQRTLQKLPSSHVMFTGGEPTFHPDFEKIILEKPDHIKLSVISNASRPIAFWERIVDKMHVVILTYHAEFSNLDRFYKTAELVFLKSKRIGLINLTMIPTHWDHCLMAYKLFRDNNIEVTVKPLLEDFGIASTKVLSTYTEQQLQWINNHTDDSYKNIIFYDKQNNALFESNQSQLIANKQTNFNGWKCYTPKYYLYISWNGDVYDTACKQRKLVGNIYTDFTPSSEPIICEQNFCWCFSDIRTSKIKDLSVNLDI